MSVKAGVLFLMILRDLRFVVIFIVLILGISLIRAIFRPRGASQPRAAATSAQRTGRYSIQVAVSPNQAGAEKFVSNLKANGFDAFMRKSKSSSGRVRYVIYVGNFNDKNSASKTLDKLIKREGIEDSFITAISK